MSDADLEIAVNQAFSQFGTVWIKIRRDRKGMPFAFAQFEVESLIRLRFPTHNSQNEQAAQQAIIRGRGLLLFGRPCRTEVARVNRQSYLRCKFSFRTLILK